MKWVHRSEGSSERQVMIIRSTGANENHIMVWVKFSLSFYSCTQLGVLPLFCGWRIEEAFFFYSPSSYKSAGGLVPVLFLVFSRLMLLVVDSLAALSYVSLLLPQRCFCKPIIAAKVSLELLCGPFGSAHVSVVRTSHIICGATCRMEMWTSCFKKSNKNFKMATAEHQPSSRLVDVLGTSRTSKMQLWGPYFFLILEFWLHWSVGHRWDVLYPFLLT